MVEMEQRMGADRTSRSLFGRHADANTNANANSNSDANTAAGVTKQPARSAGDSDYR